MNKTEKLLAARKKLKEFQLSKKGPNQDTSLGNNSTNEVIIDKVENFAEVEELTQIANEKNTEGQLIEINGKSHKENCSGIDQNDCSNFSTNDTQTFQPQVDKIQNVTHQLQGNYAFDDSVNSDLQYNHQYLSTTIDEKNKLINQLHFEVSRCMSRISELEATLSIREADFETKLQREVNPLKEQLQIQSQTTGILVGEKAELTAEIIKARSVAQQKTEELADLNLQLQNACQKIAELQRELTNTNDRRNNFEKEQSELKVEFDELEIKNSQFRKEKEDLELENLELRQKLNLKSTELMNLQQELKEKTALLSLNELRIQQLSNSPQDSQALENQHHTVVALEQHLAQVTETLRSVSEEKEEAAKQYQSYIKQLDERIEKLTKKLESSEQATSESHEQDAMLKQRIDELERQFQLERETVDSLLPLKEYESKVTEFTKSMDELNLEQERLHLVLSEKDSEIERLQQEVQDLREVKEESVDSVKLVTALDSERLAASRAVSQNQQLKQQLEEMQNAFVTLSNTKLQLTDLLETEKAYGRKMNVKLNDAEIKIKQLHEQVEQNNASLIELTKEKFQTAQVTDQMQHYQAQSESARALQEELQSSLIYIDRLKRENEEMSVKLRFYERDRISKQDSSEIETSEECRTEERKSSNEEIFVTTKASAETQTSVSVTDEQEEASCALEPLKKLETRFKDTMEKLAELTDEKQQLEHLVLQLQGETETIGEYITLYQRQRTVLQEKAKEKEYSFRQLIDQRNQQQEQLHKLKILVAELMKKQSSAIQPTTAGRKISNNNINSNCEEAHSDSPVVHENVPLVATDETASQILDLLTEIKDCKDTCNFSPDFHPCPWCSGKLITV